MNQERRTAQRFRTHLPIRLHRPADLQWIETLTKDVSLGGLRCLSPTLCPVATDLGIELIVGTGEEQISVRGRMVWFQAIPESEQFDCGIKFTEIPSSTMRRLSAYMDKLSRLSGCISA